MYIYCIAPLGNIIYYYIKVKLKILEKDIHNEFKNMKLHIENELFNI